MSDRVQQALIVLAVVVVAAAAVFGRAEHPHFAWERIPGFYGLFGLAATFLLGGVLKNLGKRWLQRRADYYGAGGED